jgi:hypothetical protein
VKERERRGDVTSLPFWKCEMLPSNVAWGTKKKKKKKKKHYT